MGLGLNNFGSELGGTSESTVTLLDDSIYLSKLSRSFTGSNQIFRVLLSCTVLLELFVTIDKWKLLKNLTPGKAAGPDKLKPLLLGELREEITRSYKLFLIDL